jgi:hypothetical protein
MAFFVKKKTNKQGLKQPPLKDDSPAIIEMEQF